MVQGVEVGLAVPEREVQVVTHLVVGDAHEPLPDERANVTLQPGACLFDPHQNTLHLAVC